MDGSANDHQKPYLPDLALVKILTITSDAI